MLLPVASIGSVRINVLPSIEGEAKAKKLAAMYIENFKQYTDTDAAKALIPSGPQLD
jgi:phosphoenolpyruvate carboxykinase (ATP)